MYKNAQYSNANKHLFTQFQQNKRWFMFEHNKVQDDCTVIFDAGDA